MKAQLSIEYVVSLSLFILFVSYLFFNILNILPLYLNEIRNERIKSEAYQISEILVNDPGEPSDWETKEDWEIKRIGLSNENYNKTNLLSVSKINRLKNECENDYDKILDWLDTDYQISITMSSKNGAGFETFHCGPSEVTIRTINVSVRRYFAFEEGYGELVLQVW